MQGFRVSALTQWLSLTDYPIKVYIQAFSHTPLFTRKPVLPRFRPFPRDALKNPCFCRPKRTSQRAFPPVNAESFSLASNQSFQPPPSRHPIKPRHNCLSHKNLRQRTVLVFYPSYHDNSLSQSANAERLGGGGPTKHLLFDNSNPRHRHGDRKPCRSGIASGSTQSRGTRP